MIMLLITFDHTGSFQTLFIPITELILKESRTLYSTQSFSLFRFYKLSLTHIPSEANYATSLDHKNLKKSLVPLFLFRPDPYVNSLFSITFIYYNFFQRISFISFPHGADSQYSLSFFLAASFLRISS